MPGAPSPWSAPTAPAASPPASSPAAGPTTGGSGTATAPTSERPRARGTSGTEVATERVARPGQHLIDAAMERAEADAHVFAADVDAEYVGLAPAYALVDRP